MIRAACTYFSTNLQLFKVIYCVYCTLDSQQNCLPFQIVFYQHSQYHQHSYSVGAGARGATEWRAKATSSLKNQMASIGTIFTSTCYAKQLNPQPNSSASRMVNHSWLSACQGKMGPIESHPSTLGHQTGLRKRPE